MKIIGEQRVVFGRVAALIGMTRVIFEVDGYLLARLCVLFEQIAVVVAVAGENYLRAEVAVGHSVNPEGSLIARDMRADENIFSAESVGDDKIGLEPAIAELLAPFIALFDGVKKAVLRDAVETLEVANALTRPGSPTFSKIIGSMISTKRSSFLSILSVCFKSSIFFSPKYIFPLCGHLTYIICNSIPQECCICKHF